MVNNCTYERKISFINNQWDNQSDKSSSQESMNVVDPKDEFRLSTNNSRNERNFVVVKSSSRDNLVCDRRNLTANYPSNWKELTNARLENSNGFQQQKNGQDGVVLKDDAQDDPASFVSKKPSGIHSGVKVTELHIWDRDLTFTVIVYMKRKTNTTFLLSLLYV